MLRNKPRKQEDTIGQMPRLVTLQVFARFAASTGIKLLRRNML
jgi:hypothetical protein